MTGLSQTTEINEQRRTAAGVDRSPDSPDVLLHDRRRDHSQGSSKRPYLVLAFILLVTAIAYSPVFFNFFNGDDFVHLSWLKDAVKHPELIWRNFHSAWLDGTTARFYRPLISVFMVSDYLLWGANGLGFRLTNLMCHVFSTIFLFFIVRRLFVLGKTEKEAPVAGGQTWALVSAALFALYPLHPEAVSWITGRVDSVVTVFYLGSLWFYMQWRSQSQLGSLLAAGSFMVLGLLSKEMAVTLPVTFLVFEALLGSRQLPAGHQRLGANRAGAQHGGAPTVLRRAIQVVLPTVPFWVVLAAYFGVRRLALGTFVGGYDDSLFFVSDWKAFIFGWIHGVRMLLVPINKDFLGAHHVLTKTWEVSLALCFALGAWTVFRESPLRRPAGFVVLWLFLALVPVYKIFAIGDDLQGSRLAYLATAPLCVLIAVAFARSVGLDRQARVTKPIVWALSLVICASAATLLWTNNQSWAAAGREVNAIRTALDSLYRQIPGDPQVLLIGLPDHIHGAYTCRNALFGMTKYPQLHRDIQNCYMVNRYDPILPFGFLKDSLKGSQDQIRMLRWAGAERGFVPITCDQVSHTGQLPDVIAVGQLPANRTGEQTTPLANILEPLPKPGSRYRWLPDGTLEVLGGSGFRGRPELNLKLAASPCWSVDFIAVDLVVPEPDAYKSVSGADILYANELGKDFELSRRSHADIKVGLKKQQLIFAFRSSTDWSFGGDCVGLKLLLPDGARVIVKSVKIVPAPEIMPTIDFTNSGYLGTKGFIHLSTREPSLELFIDASSVTGARGAILEITRPNLLFESQNSQRASSVVMKTLQLPSISGKIVLERDMFPASVMYEIRAWAIDAAGGRVGVAGDHLVVCVDP